jgi:hypothetical protein
MHTTRDELPTLMETPDAVVQQQREFGELPAETTLSAERMQFTAGTDITPLLEGLPDDACPVPHWGYVIEGEITISYADGSEETDRTGDVVYWPPGHTARANEATEVILFSPQEAHLDVFDHMAERMDA